MLPKNKLTLHIFSIVFLLASTVTVSATNVNIDLNQFYRLKDHNPKQAEIVLKQVLRQTPNNETAIMEMGYLLLKQNRIHEALFYFKEAKKLDPNNVKLHLQLAYILNKLDKNRLAYYEFSKTAQSTDPEISLKSNLAMVNLGGEQTKIFPSPYFFDVYFAPYYSSRFNSIFFPGQIRLGINYGAHRQNDFYFTIYGNKDTHSSGGNIPIIYSDNSLIYALGVRNKLFLNLPIFIYLEAGRAYNLLKNTQQQWENELRTGLFSYIKWGEKPTYAPDTQFPLQHIGDLYINISYYSRYRRNTIGEVQLREGIRLARYKNFSIDSYLNLKGFGDTRRYYYNNIFEIGPGIAITPDNRYNVVFRIEALKGYYLTTNSSQGRPNNNCYYNVMAQLETYFRF